MAISPGTRLGPYEMLSAIGAGGMGEVYRARDSKLGRDVAIKVLPANFVNDPDRLSRSEVWVLPLTPERPGAPLKAYPFAQSPFNESDGQFSPDGRWIAYNSDESQRVEVYVARFPGAGSKRQISVAGGSSPRWRRDGKEIFYDAPDGKVMSAAVAVKGDALQVGEVRPLFSPPANISIDTFEVSADGQRFLILAEQQTINEGVTVILNWAAGLKK